MKEVDRSVHSIDVVKKKSSSGCLIIKKKVPLPVPDGIGGVKGFNDSSSRNLFSSVMEKKRPRLIRSDPESSEDEFTEPHRRKIDNFHSGSGFTNGRFRENRGLETRERSNNLIDVHAFDEYDGSREMRVRNDGYAFKHRMNSHWQNGDDKASGSGGSSSRRIYDYRKDFVDDNRSSNFGMKSHYKMEDNESRLPISQLSGRYREASDQPIRLQGKNGVLKVMVKKHKPISITHQTHDPVEYVDRKESIPVLYKEKHPNVSHKVYDHWDSSNKNKKVDTGSSSYPTAALKRPGKPVSSKKRDLELTKNGSDTPLPLKVSSMHHSIPEKTVKSEQRVNRQTKNVTPVKGKETKVKRGTGTEKQLLREKIRSMLLSAGWTIDYRPRRNRDYLDAVYINHSGTAYWSIIKAYEAFQKEEKDRSRVRGEFTPLPVETLNKLTRQTRKKIEREMNKKRRDEGRTAEGAETAKRRIVEASQDIDDDDDDDDSNDSYYRETDKERNVGVNLDMVRARKSNKLGGRTLLIRSDGIKRENNDQSGHHSGKLTLLSWLIDSGKVKMCEKVQYMNERKTMVMKEGWITKEGIRCCCCNKILTVSMFEVHAGSKLCQPFLNIFVESVGQSLMKCLIDAWNKQQGLERIGYHSVNVNGDDPNDDTCGLCGDGGDLICCDGCPSTFHQTCLGIQMLPKGDWHCPNCSCKFCEMANTSVGTESPLLVCALCEKKYHESCSLELDKPTDPTDPNLSFCSHKCLQVYGHLKKLVGVKHELGSGLSWSLIRRSDISSDTCSSRELAQRVECNSKLAVARTVIDECFLPVIDRRSGINLIHNVVYNCGSNLSRMNYSGFLTAILEKGDELISAASIRIHGTQLAEMPFIGTRSIYRRQGMCSRLLSTIESVLSSIGIEKLVIPAIAENMDAWTGAGGFNPLDESHKHEMKSMNMLVLPGIDMLQKPLVSVKSSLRTHKASIDVEKSEPISVVVKEFVDKKTPAMEKSELNSVVDKESVEKKAPTTEKSEPNSFEDRESLVENGPVMEKSEPNSLNGDEFVEKNGPEMEKSEPNSCYDEQSVEKNAPATKELEPNSFDEKESLEKNVPPTEKSEPNSSDEKESVEKNAPPAMEELEPNSFDDKESVEKNDPRTEKSEPDSFDGKDYVEKNDAPGIEKSELNSFDGKESVEKDVTTTTTMGKSEPISFDGEESVEKNAPPAMEKSESNSFDDKESVEKNGCMEEKSEPNSHDDNEADPTMEKSEPDFFKDREPQDPHNR